MMGLYDEYGRKPIQLKNGPCMLDSYSIGDKVPLNDGIYIGYEGCVVIKNGIFIADFDKLIDKWGGIIDPEKILDNPLESFIPKLENEQAENKRLVNDTKNLRHQIKNLVKSREKKDAEIERLKEALKSISELQVIDSESPTYAEFSEAKIIAIKTLKG